jgi:putative serine protease PepD
MPEEAELPDGDGEDEPGLPPHPLDRVWFHPSELGAPPAPPEPEAASPPARGWALGVAGAVCGVVATLGLLVATGNLGSSGDRVGSTSGLVPVFAQLQSDRAARLVATASASVVAVRATGLGQVRGSGLALGGDRIVTSAQLVQGTPMVSVTTAQGRVLPATIAGSDAETDLALLRVNGAHLPTARLGSSDGLAVGSWVLALGTSSGGREWAAQGVVSGLGVLVDQGDGTQMPGMVQTDVTVPPESGGGALVDDNGEVVAILSRAAPGHALPVDVAREVAEQLGASGKVRHAWLGVDTLDASDRAGGGAVVQSVTPEGPAAAAGLQVGDVITSVGDDRVTDLADLLAAVDHRRPGDPVDVTLWRADQRLHRTATLAERT